MIRNLLSFLLFFAGTAVAVEPLTTERVENFLSVAETLDELAEEYPDFDIDLGSDNPTEVMETMISEEGEFRLFNVMTERMRANPDVNNRFLGVIRDHGFSDAQEFASVGDQIALTTMALSLAPSDLQEFVRAAFGGGPGTASNDAARNAHHNRARPKA